MKTEVLTAFAGTLWHSRRMQSRRSFEKWQDRKVTRWLLNSPPKVYAYQTLPQRIGDLPIIDKAVLMADFAQ